MRFASVWTVTLMLSIPSCALQVVDGSRVYGHIHSVSLADIRAAMDADRKINHGEQIYEIEVISKDEMHIYDSRREEGGWSHRVIKRVHGKWQDAGGVIVTS
jgi:hypothetical protein